MEVLSCYITGSAAWRYLLRPALAIVKLTLISNQNDSLSPHKWNHGSGVAVARPASSIMAQFIRLISELWPPGIKASCRKDIGTLQDRNSKLSTPTEYGSPILQQLQYLAGLVAGVTGGAGRNDRVLELFNVPAQVPGRLSLEFLGQ